MDVSCWSFIRMAHLAEPLMKNGGTLFTMTYYGSQMVVKNYNVMGVAKAALKPRGATSPPSSARSHSRPRHFAGTAGNPRGIRIRNRGRVARQGAEKGADAQPGQHR